MNEKIITKFESKDITIFDALKNIQKRKYILPAFQRQYVWNLAQVEKLWDSILIGYPISSFLFWHLDKSNYSSEARFCDFLSSVAFKSGKHEPANNKFELSGIDVEYTDTAVLDGQQRLTSLFISLFGEVMIRQKWAQSNAKASPAFLYLELDKENLDFYDDGEDFSEHDHEYNVKKYGFAFTSKTPTPTQLKIRTLITDSRFGNKNERAQAITEALNNRPVQDKEYAFNIIDKLAQKIYDEPIIRYTELFGVKQSDALEIFVRFNSGGKTLRRSEITMSILEAYWPDAKSHFNKALSGVYRDFSTDFIIRSALMLYSGDVKGEIDGRIARVLRDNWVTFVQTMHNLASLLDSMNIKISHYCNSWNILIPIFCSVYYNPEYEKTALAIKTYLVRASLFDYFKNGTTAKLQQMKKFLVSNNFVMDAEGLSYAVPALRVSDAKIEEILDSEKGSRIAGEVLYFLGLDWINQKTNIKYDQDHMHPAEGFNKMCPNGVNPKDWMRWQQEYNKLPNLQYLSAGDNRSKNQTSLYEYYHNELDSQRQQELIQQGMIPEGVSLELRDFGDFYEKRKDLLRYKLRELLKF